MMPKQADSVETIPAWAINALGDGVMLTKPVDEYGDGAFVFRPGQTGRLAAIQASDNGPCGLVEFSDGTLLDVPFESMVPAE